MPKIPGVPHLQAVRALGKAGFKVNAFTMGGIAQDAGLTPEEFRKLV